MKSKIGLINKRIKFLEGWLKNDYPEIFKEQKHLDEGTEERVYWHYGYLMGMKNVLDALKWNRTKE